MSPNPTLNAAEPFPLAGRVGKAAPRPAPPAPGVHAWCSEFEETRRGVATVLSATDMPTLIQGRHCDTARAEGKEDPGRSGWKRQQLGMPTTVFAKGVDWGRLTPLCASARPKAQTCISQLTIANPKSYIETFGSTGSIWPDRRW